MGGLAGRIKYLHEGSITFGELKNILEGISSNKIPLYEKVDGFNCYFSSRNGLPVMARNMTEAKQGGLTILELSNKDFKGGSSVKRVFIEALKNFSKDYKNLDRVIFEDENNQVFYNFEVVSKNTNRLFEYDSNGLILHNSGHFFIREGKRVQVASTYLKEGSVDSNFIKHNFKTTLTENSSAAVDSVIKEVCSLMEHELLHDDSPISSLKESRKLQEILNSFSCSFINSLSSNFITNEQEKVSAFKGKIKEAVHSLLNNQSDNRAQIIEKTISFLNQFPSIDEVNSCIEGVILEHGGELYKLTGYYGPINQLYGLYQRESLLEFSPGSLYPIDQSDYNVDKVLTHPTEKTLAVFPGSFKPPHAGHYRIVQELKDLKNPQGMHTCNKIIILISNKARMAQGDNSSTYVSADMSHNLWELYVSNEDVNTRVEIRVADHDTPIKCIYDIMLEEMAPGETLLLAMSGKDGESDRFGGFKEFSDKNDLGVKVAIKQMNTFSAGVSASNMRNWIADGDEDRFKGFLPDHLTSEERAVAWALVNNGEDVSLNENSSFFLNEVNSPQQDAAPPISEDLLEEGAKERRLATIHKKYPEYKEEIDLFAAGADDEDGFPEFDITPYLSWMVRSLQAGNRPTDIVIMIKLFLNFKPQLKSISYSTDIFHYDFDELLAVFKTMSITPIFNNKASPLRNASQENTTIIYEDTDLFVVRPHNHEASVLYGQSGMFGQDGVWCISAKDTEKHWNEYAEQNQVHYFYIHENVLYEEDTMSKFDVIVGPNGIDTVWNKPNKNTHYSVVEQAIGVERADAIEELILEDYENNPENEHSTPEHAELVVLAQEIEADTNNRKYIWMTLEDDPYDDGDHYWSFRASFYIDLSEFNLKLKKGASARDVNSALQSVIDYNAEDVELYNDQIRATLVTDYDQTANDIKYYFEDLSGKDDLLQEDDPEDNIQQLLYQLYQDGVIESEEYDSKQEILQQMEDHDFEHLSADWDEEDGLEVTYRFELKLPSMPLGLIWYDENAQDNPQVIDNLRTGLDWKTFDVPELKIILKQYLPAFPKELIHFRKHETNLSLTNNEAIAIIDKNLNMSLFGPYETNKPTDWDTARNTVKQLKDLSKDNEFLQNDILANVYVKNNKLITTNTYRVSFGIYIGIPNLIQIKTEQLNNLLTDIVDFDKDTIAIKEIQNSLANFLISKRKSVIYNNFSGMPNLGKAFTKKYYLHTEDLSEQKNFTNKVLDECGPKKTVIVWTSSRDNKTDQHFLDIKTEASQRGIDASSIYYAPFDEQYLKDYCLFETEIDGDTSDQYAVVPKMNTRMHWYLNQLKTENKWASRSLKDFGLLRENRVDFLQKTYREKIFNKLINQLTELSGAEITHLNWIWAKEAIFQAMLPSHGGRKEDPIAGENLLALFQQWNAEDDIERLKDQAFEFFVDTDPSQKKKYTQWLIFRFIKEGVRIEDIWSVKGALEIFEELSTRNIIRGVDINSLTIRELQDLVSEHEDALSARQKQGKGDEAKNILQQEVKFLFQKDDYVMAIPKSQRASCLLGKKTNWCTASQGERNMYDYYAEDGPLIVFITPEGKWQLHIESDQFMDSNDYQIDLLKWLKENEIFMEPLMKFLKENNYREKINQGLGDDYQSYHGLGKIQGQVDTLLFNDALTEEVAVTLVEHQMAYNNYGSQVQYKFGAEEKNNKIFDLFWDSNFEEVKDKWIIFLNKLLNENKYISFNLFMDNFNRLLMAKVQPEYFKEKVLPILASNKFFFYELQLNYMLKKSPTALGSLATQNTLTILEHELEFGKGKHDDIRKQDEVIYNNLTSSPSVKKWTEHILQNEQLKTWFLKWFDRKESRGRQLSTSINMLKSKRQRASDIKSARGALGIARDAASNLMQQTGKSLRDLWEDDQSLLNTFLPRIKENLSFSINNVTPRTTDRFPFIEPRTLFRKGLFTVQPEISVLWEKAIMSHIEGFDIYDIDDEAGSNDGTEEEISQRKLMRRMYTLKDSLEKIYHPEGKTNKPADFPDEILTRIADVHDAIDKKLTP